MVVGASCADGGALCLLHWVLVGSHCQDCKALHSTLHWLVRVSPGSRSQSEAPPKTFEDAALLLALQQLFTTPFTTSFGGPSMPQWTLS